MKNKRSQQRAHGAHGHKQVQEHSHHDHSHHGHSDDRSSSQQHNQQAHSYDEHRHHGHSHHGHSHGSLHHHNVSDGNRQGLIIALIITATIMALEFVGGLLTKSLALLSDSGHMLSDSSSLILSLIAFWFSTKASASTRTFGNHRFEIIAALFNAITLFIVAGFIIAEAFERLMSPTEVASGSMIIIASIGLVANLLSAYVLMRKGDVEHNVNMRSAYLHVIGDMLGSIGAIVAGFIMLTFNWYYADPIISVVVALLILRSAWGVLKLSLHILMEGAPADISIKLLEQSLRGLPQVTDVHDLHVWTLTSGLHSLSCHLLVEEGSDEQAVLAKAIQLAEQKGIKHSTFQIERGSMQHGACPLVVS